AFTGRMVHADEAERIGLVNRVVPEDELLECCGQLADQIVANSPGGVRMTKRALHASMESASFAAAIEMENRGQALLMQTDDMREALEALRSKRPPVFTGR
ncbi:MAG: enoyl-CoA hydratase/carnithine racemase, partial [Marmoricola sp.]|nr:enoyl-CoA hydratase/carnithine racemase [Marmoricola sp.]